MTASDGPRRFNMRWGVACLVASVGLIVGGLLAFNLAAPDHIDLIRLQWTRSGSEAQTFVRGDSGAYRTGIYWDFVLIAGYTGGLLLACYLGLRVFWTAGLLRWALVGAFAVVVAALANILQDALLLNVLGSQPLEGTWVFRVVAAASFVKFCSLLVAVLIGLPALGTAFSRLVTHRSIQNRWKEAAKAVNLPEPRPENMRSVIIPPAPIESDRTQPVRVSGNGTAEKAASEDWSVGRKLDLDESIDRTWWREKGRSAAPVHFTQDTQSPNGPGEGPAICLSGGGIRSASVALGALQSLRARLGGLSGVHRIVSVSGGGYTNGGLQLALTDPNGNDEKLNATQMSEVFAPGSVEEDHLRRHSSYLSDGPGQWLVALGVLFRNLLLSLVIIGLSVSAVGLAIGFFYRHVPIVSGGLETLYTRMLASGRKPPGYPSVTWGVIVGVCALIGLALVLYAIEMAVWSLRGRRPATLARVVAAPAIAALVLVAIGVVVPAVVWVSSWLTWHLGISSKPMVAAGSITTALSYIAVLVALGHSKVVKTALTDVNKGKKVVSGVLPNSMVQKILIWIALLALVATALVAAGWVATSGLDDSWWAFLVVGPLAFLIVFLDQTSMSLHPFYRRRLASAFAVRRSGVNSEKGWQPDPDGVAVAVPYSYDETTELSRYGEQRDGWPKVTFAASANLSGQSRTPPGRRTVSYALNADYVGGPQVGWVRTDFLQRLVSRSINKDLTVEAAIAISGAAIASAMGAQTRDYEVFLSLTNVRLGAWLPNPRFVALKCANLDDWTVPGLPRIRGLAYFAREIFGIHSDHSRLLLCTDGGHYENLGLVETLRHRPETVYCFDASGATEPMADTLAGALMLAREELGVEVTLNRWQDLVPGSGEGLKPTDAFSGFNSRLSLSAVITGSITYPEVGNAAKSTGQLIFAQADLTRDLPYDILEFKQDDPGFPNDGTADQWFDCNRFDAYKGLGSYLGDEAVKARESLDTPPPATPGGNGSAQQTPPEAPVPGAGDGKEIPAARES
jgi:hypothetical protein